MPHDDPSPGFRRADTQERLAGCGLIIGGLIGMGVAFLLWRVVPLTAPTPPGMPSSFAPLLSPVTCMIPMVAVLAAGLVLLGLKKLVSPD